MKKMMKGKIIESKSHEKKEEKKQSKILKELRALKRKV